VLLTLADTAGRYVYEIRDTDGGQQRQQAIAGQVFDALRSAGRWRTVYIDDMQRVLDSYDPAQ
jgi:hypothetical protein